MWRRVSYGLMQAAALGLATYRRRVRAACRDAGAWWLDPPRACREPAVPVAGGQDLNGAVVYRTRSRFPIPFVINVELFVIR